jgi:hypothetical protein
MEHRNLFGEAERIAARAASVSTRRQYASIFRAFGDWLAGELGRPPLVGDLDTDAIAAYGRHLATAGGRGGRPAAPATSRVYRSMIRALARNLGPRTRSTGSGSRGTSRARPRRSPTPTTPTSSAFLTAARSPANATMPYSACSATAGFAPPSSEASAPAISAAPAQTPGIIAYSYAAKAAANARSPCLRLCSRRSRRG